MRFRKVLASTLCLLTLMSIGSTSFAATGGGKMTSNVFWSDQIIQTSRVPMKVSINGEIVETDDVVPEEIDGRLYVPVSFVKRYIASTMTVDRNLKDVEFDNGRLKFDLKGREATSYGYPVTFIGNAYITNGTIMVPIRTVAGIYNYFIRYNGYSRIVELYQ